MVLERERKVDRVLANHSLSSTASQGTSNIPVSWFLLLGCYRQARTLFFIFMLSHLNGFPLLVVIGFFFYLFQ